MSNDLLTNERQELADAMFRYGIPIYMHQALARHVFEGGGAGGGFLTAMLCNDGWSTVLQRADDKNRDLMPAYWRFLWQSDVVPRECWGSPEKVKAWRERGGLKRGADSDSDA